MGSRTSIRFLIAVAVLAGCAPESAKHHPNVVVILSDDQGYGDVGVYGSKDIPTPHIDSIARNGVRFSNGYVSAPQCAPSRAGLLTGRYQNRFGFEENRYSLDGGLPPDEVTFGDRMRAAGRVTGLIGKWHVGIQDYNHPLDFIGRHQHQPEWQLDGVNLLPYLEGELSTPPHDVLFWRFLFRPNAVARRFWAIRQGDWKLVSENFRIPGVRRAWRSVPKLFDLRVDPHEDHDRRDAKSERADALAARWAAWNSLPMPPGQSSGQ